MKAAKQNKYLMWMLFALLASNMSFFEPQFSGEIANFSSLGLNGDPNFTSLDSNCQPSGAVYGTYDQKGTINEGTDDEKDAIISWKYKFSKATCKSSGFSALANGEGTSEEMGILELEATSCADGSCRETFSVPVKSFINFIASKAKESSLEIFENMAVAEKMQEWEEKVAECKAQWKDDDNHEEGIKKIKGSELTECHVDYLIENEFEDEDETFAYYKKNVARQLERMLLSNSRIEREQALDLIAEISEADIEDRVTGYVDAMNGYGYYDQEFKALLAQYYNGEINKYQMDMGIRSLQQNAYMDFISNSSIAVDNNTLAEYRYWQNAVNRNANFIMFEPEMAYRDINGNSSVSKLARDDYYNDPTRLNREHIANRFTIYDGGARSAGPDNLRLPVNPLPRNNYRALSAPRRHG